MRKNANFKPINYCKSVEVDAEKCEKIPNQFVFKATYGVAQKRLISKKGKTQKKLLQEGKV